MDSKEFTQVVVAAPLDSPLLYAVPEHLRGELRRGMRVLVPLGKRRVTGLVVGFSESVPITGVREILELLDPAPVLEESLIETCFWLSSYYLAPIGEVVSAALPSGLRVESRRTAVLRMEGVEVPGDLAREVYAEIERKQKVSLSSLAQRYSGRGFYRALDQLVTIGAIDLREGLRGAGRKGRRSSAPPGRRTADAPPASSLPPTVEQEQALRAIQSRIEAGGFEPFLLFGVTGSGKTEVYLRAMETAWRQGKRSLILVPEISLAPQLLSRLEERFPGGVGVLHSRLSPAERREQWWRIRRGDVAVVIGARSAVFAPVPDLGLIVVDEEHDPSYKQEEGVRYHARDVAVVRAKLGGCAVILGSATPAIETFQNALRGRYRLLELKERVESRPLPSIEVVDLKLQPPSPGVPEERFKPRAELFSPLLAGALQDNCRRGYQSLIFLNRRGFANFLQCRLCGFVVRCAQCSVALTFHLKEQSLLCHHCGSRQAVRDLCPACSSPALGGVGFGTEQVEKELMKILPQARIARMDRDTVRRRGVQERMLRDWEKGEFEVLVGTQMITKGHDVAAVTLVGVLLADTSLNLPDFRAAERTFQLLSQVAGRAGRGKDPGRVIIQTYAPDHYVLQRVIDHDFKGFFDSEVEFRRALNYPPFSRLVQLRLEGPKAAEVERGARYLRQKLARPAAELEVLGPAPAPIERLRNRYRWHILLKGNRLAVLLEEARRARRACPRRGGLRLHIDVDPYSML